MKPQHPDAKPYAAQPRRPCARATRALAACLFLAGASPAPAASWRAAEPGWNYRWPQDLSPHREFKTEWWYFTGHLRDGSGRPFGFQLVFFRQGIRPPGSAPAATSRFVTDQIALAHFSVTDPGRNLFRFSQRTSRGAFGEAGFGDRERVAWVGDWSCRLDEAGAFRLLADHDGTAIDLTLTPSKQPVVHGRDGLSRKAEGPGRASHYHSITRLEARGRISLGENPIPVTGHAWFDQEWATNQLAPDQQGWDWFSLQFDDGYDLMLYRLRRRDGTADPASSGTLVDPRGEALHLERDEFSIEPAGFWTSPQSGGRYPVRWRVSVPKHRIELEVTTPLEKQELFLPPLVYWEGMVSARGSRDGRALSADGYLEMTGYAGRIPGLAE